MEDKIKKIRDFKNMSKFDELLLMFVKENIEAESKDDECNPFAGYVTDILNIYENSKDKESVEKLFFEFTGIDFEEFLDSCIKEYI